MMYIATFITAIASLIAALVGIFSIWHTTKSAKQQQEFTAESTRKQQEHNRNSVKPVCSIRLSALQTKIAINLHNVGSGPLIMKEFSCVSCACAEGDGESYSTPYKFLGNKKPEDNSNHECVFTDPSEMSIGAGESVNLVRFEQREGANEKQFREARYQLLKELGKLKIFVKYEDVYRTTIFYDKSLKFFERTAKEENDFERSEQL